ncbi:MAG TPA: glutamyl-tRNA reductase [Candidatus Dormibacteraeota bacterium]|nr:glutamyl-tRNA reductase [Candidatus Dormibacteraeota bacterium]
MKFVVLGLSHKSAPLDVREQVFIPETGVGECVRRLIDHDLIESGVLLSTCNRTELYAIASANDTPDRLFESFGLWPHQLPFEAWQRYAYRLTGDDAMDHLFRVAGGLDSLMIGEAQVLGQLKRALSLARQAGALDAQLEIIIRGALRAAKRIRHETGLGRRPVSVGHAAVAATQDVLGGLAGRNVLLLGAGEMSEVTLRLLRNQRIGSVYLASRRFERADEVAQTGGAAAVPFDGIEEIIGSVDIIVSSSSAPHHLLDAGRVTTFQERRGGRPLLIVDMAVPRDVDPDAAGVAGVHLLNIDDLQRVAETNREAREAFVPAAEEIVAEEVRATGQALDARESAPTVQALVSRVERLRDGVLERHLARVPASEVETREAMRDLADALTAKFLHGPIRALRESPDPTLEAAVINDAFELDRNPS